MKILLAVSGGPDSMCMADKFSRSSMGDGIAVAHCNFRLRGQESDADEALVRSWAEARGLEFFVTGFDTEGYAAEHGVSIEMAARELRYDWFVKVARQNGFDALAVAHNADDNAETLLLNLLRGTGVRGASGMRPEGTVPGADDIILLRPLLGMSRKDIDRYNEQNSVPFRTDATNLQTLYRRNKIRHKVLPVFSEINPSYLQTLARDMEAFCQASDILDDFFESVKDSVQKQTTGSELLRLDARSLVANRHWKYILFRFLEKYGFSRGDLDALCHLLEQGGTISGKTFCSSEYRLVTTQADIVVAEADALYEGTNSVLVGSEGEYHLLGHKLTVSVEPWSSGMALKQPAGVLVADSRALRFPFVVRRWEDGDAICPLGMNGRRKKVSDILSDLKVDILAKDTCMVIQPSGKQKPVALVGLRIDESLKVSDDTVSVVRISLD